MVSIFYIDIIDCDLVRLVKAYPSNMIVRIAAPFFLQDSGRSHLSFQV